MTGWLVTLANGALLMTATLSLQTTAPNESALDKLLRIAGLTAAPSQLRGATDQAVGGNLWIVDLDGGAPRALTTNGGYRSPVFSPVDQTIYALREKAIVRLPSRGGAVAKVQNASNVVKLVGFEGKSAEEMVVLLDGAAGSPLGVALLGPGRIAVLPYDGTSAEMQRMLAQARAEDRTYGDTTVYLKTETKRGLTRNVEWTDVYVQQRDASPRNVSRCDGVRCGQPALSPDGRSVVFVKSED